MHSALHVLPALPVSRSASALVRQGFKWSFAFMLAQGVAQVCVTMTMARLLLPEQYGLYAMAEVVLRWGGLMAQMGLGTVLVQKQILADSDLSAARSLSVGLGLVATVAVVATAPLIASWFENPSLVPLLRVASFSFVIAGFGLTSGAMLRRRMEFGRLGVADLVGYSVGNGLTAVFLASRGAGVWSIVIGSLTGQLLQNALAVAQARLPHGFSLRFSAILPLFRQGFHVSVNTCLDITNNTMDTLVVGRVMPPAVVGLFNRAAMLSALPANFLWSAVSRVTFPNYSRLQHEPRAFTAFLRRVQEWSGTLCVAVPLGMIPAADCVVQFLLGSGWLPAVPIVRLLLLGIAFESLAFPYHNALDALGRYSDRTKVRLIIFAIRATALALAALYRTDLLFYVAALAAASTWLISIRPVAHALREPFSVFLLDDLKVLGRAGVCAVAVGGARLLGGAAHLPTSATLVLSILSGLAALALVLRRHLVALRTPSAAMASEPGRHP